MVRTTLGAEVNTTVTVSGSESVEFINATELDNLPANTQERITVTPPSGFVYELIALRLQATGISGESGTTHLAFLQSEALGIAAIRGRATGDQDLKYRYGHWSAADNTALPPDTASQTAVVKGLRADDQSGYQITYNNKTSSTQTNSRRYSLWVRKIKVE